MNALRTHRVPRFLSKVGLHAGLGGGFALRSPMASEAGVVVQVATDQADHLQGLGLLPMEGQHQGFPRIGRANDPEHLALPPILGPGQPQCIAHSLNAGSAGIGALAIRKAANELIAAHHEAPLERFILIRQGRERQQQKESDPLKQAKDFVNGNVPASSECHLPSSSSGSFHL